MAATDRDRVVAAAVSAGEAIADSEEPTTTIESVAADALLEQGIVDDNKVRQKHREKVLKTAFALLRREGPEVDRDRWPGKLETFPEALREERLRELRPYIRIDEERVVLRRDPYTGRGERTRTEVPSLSE